MNAPELRKKIMEQIGSIENEELLQEIYEVIKVEAGLHSVYKLTEAESSAVAEGLSDVREGRVYTSEEANSLLKEWLKK